MAPIKPQLLHETTEQQWLLEHMLMAHSVIPRKSDFIASWPSMSPETPPKLEFQVGKLEEPGQP